MLQKCKFCLVEKPIDAFEVRSDTKKRRGVCRACRSQKAKEKYAENPEAWKESGKRYREKNREKYLQKAREYASANKERMNETSRRWVRENRTVVIERSVAWRKANRERVREAAKLLRNANPEKFRSVVRNRRAKLKVLGSHGPADIAFLFQQQKGICKGCRCNLKESGYHVDHIQAVANGGSNNPENLQLLCPTCNISKGAKDMREWAEAKGYV